MRKENIAREDSFNNFINKNAGTIAMIPAYLLCFITLMMLILDMILPSMSDGQYLIYPLAARLVSLISILCMAACLGCELERGRFSVGPEDLFFIGFTVCMLISTYVNGITHDAIFSVAYRYVGVYDLIIFIFIYRYCASHAFDSRMKRLFFLAFILVADLIAIAFFYNLAEGSIAAFNGKLEPSAIFFHGNHYGYFLVMVIAVSAGCLIYYNGAPAIIGAVSLAVNLGALALNRSMGCLIAAGVVLTAVLAASIIRGGIKRKKALFTVTAILVLAAVGLTVLKDFREDLAETATEFIQILSGENNIYAGNGRWGIWQYVADYIKDSPYWGYGCEGIAEIMRDYTLTTSPHNEPLTYAAFFGIPAAVFYCAAVFTSIIKGFRQSEQGAEKTIAAFAAMAYFISSLFGVAFFYTAPFMFVFLGLSSEKKRMEPM